MDDRWTLASVNKSLRDRSTWVRVNKRTLYGRSGRENSTLQGWNCSFYNLCFWPEAQCDRHGQSDSSVYWKISMYSVESCQLKISGEERNKKREEKAEVKFSKSSTDPAKWVKRACHKLPIKTRVESLTFVPFSYDIQPCHMPNNIFKPQTRPPTHPTNSRKKNNKIKTKKNSILSGRACALLIGVEGAG